MHSEDQDDVTEALGRIIPMSRIIPGVPKENRSAGVGGSMEDCDNPECLARQDRYRELADANGTLRTQFEVRWPTAVDLFPPICFGAEISRFPNHPWPAPNQELEVQLKLTLNKLQLMDKANKSVEDANDKLQEQLDEIRGRTSILEVEASQGQKVDPFSSFGEAVLPASPDLHGWSTPAR